MYKRARGRRNLRAYPGAAPPAAEAPLLADLWREYLDLTERMARGDADLLDLALQQSRRVDAARAALARIDGEGRRGDSGEPARPPRTAGN